HGHPCLLCFTAPPPPPVYPLSLHDALPISVAADITSEQGRIAALAACPQPDILITNAGGPPPGEFRKFSREDWQKALGENLRNRSEEHTSELQSRRDLVCRLLLEKKKTDQ